jgi:putative nucleotidyltransferase with HDIG domain
MNEKKSIQNYQEFVKPGDHLVVLYKTETEVINTVVGYIKGSILRNEKCIYITDGANLKSIKQILEFDGIDNSYIEKGQLVFLENKDAYSKDGKFDPDKMVELLKVLTDQSIEEGYNGLAISGEISWVLDYDEGFDLIIEYEWKINDQIFDKYPVSALCRYNMNKFTPEMIINVIQLHPFIAMNDYVYENPFFIPAEGYKSNSISEYQVKTWLENIVNFTNTKSQFHSEIKKKEEEKKAVLLNLTNEIVISFSGIIEIHDPYTKHHSENVANIAKALAIKLKLSNDDINKTYLASLVHDIGKVFIPENILNKNNKLSDKEFNEIKKHPLSGYSILSKSKHLKDIADIVLSHHERWDGDGYPNGIEKNQIPLISRILCIVDSYDAMTHDRPYRRALTKAAALNEIELNMGKQFDPYISKIFLELIA